MGNMPEPQTIDYYQGSGTSGLAFSDLDQHYRLKHRAFIEICMSPILEDLERNFPMYGLREKGIVPIMFYLDIQSAQIPISFGRKVISEYEISIQRTEPDPGSGVAPRLLLDMRNTLKAHRSTGHAASLGFEKEKGPLESAGSCEVLQVFTRPLAPAGERAVIELPEELQAFNVLPWKSPYPTVELVQTEPEGWTEAEPGDWRESTSVWGMPNTDMNQHINVEEYIAHMENHVSRLLHGAGLPLANHHNQRARLIFRRPSFPGDLFGLRGRIWTKDGRTLCTTGLHGITPQGEWSPRAYVAARFEGGYEEG